MSIGPRLRRLRLARGMTQKQLADGRYTHAYVSSIEAGRRRPSREALEHFAAQLGIDPDELATGRPADLRARLELRRLGARVALSAGRLAEAEKELLAIEREARKHRLPVVEAKAEQGLGLLLERRGRPEDALVRYQRAEALLQDQPVTARVDAVDGKASCFTVLGDVRYAIHLLESLVDEFGRQGLRDPDALARVHASLVSSYLEAGLFARAAEAAAELGRLAPRVTDPVRIGQMHMHVAQLHLAEGRIEDAERSLQRAEDAFRILGLEAEAGHAHLARGYVLSREGRIEEAYAELTEALRIFERTADEKDVTRTLNELARIERLRGKPDAARALLERSIAILGASDTPILARAHRELGLTLAETEPAAAEKSLRTAIELYERTEQGVDVAVTYRSLGDLLDAAGDATGAAEAYRTGILALEPLR